MILPSLQLHLAELISLGHIAAVSTHLPIAHSDKIVCQSLCRSASASSSMITFPHNTLLSISCVVTNIPPKMKNAHKSPLDGSCAFNHLLLTTFRKERPHYRHKNAQKLPSSLTSFHNFLSILSQKRGGVSTKSFGVITVRSNRSY